MLVHRSLVEVLSIPVFLFAAFVFSKFIEYVMVPARMRDKSPKDKLSVIRQLIKDN